MTQAMDRKMNNMDTKSKIELYPHNQKAYDELCAMLERSDRACVVQPTGTGKFVIIARMVQDNPKKRFLLLGTNEYMYADQMANLSDIAPGFTPGNLQFMTYAAAMTAARNEAAVPRYEVIVADEFHHCGAPEWSKGVQYVTGNNPAAKIVGFSATPIRYSDNGRDMSDEMFEGNVASSMELEEAWLRGILPIPKYVIALYDAPKELDELKVSIEKVRGKKKHSKFVKKYEELRRSLQDADGIDRIIARHLGKRDGKVIVFCPNQEKLREFMLLRREWFGSVNDEVHIYKTTSADPYGSRDFRDFKADGSSALKVLYCINQLNEAVHVKGIDAIVMVRPTKSPVIFQQQLGRVLSSGGNQTPVVFDLCNNFGSLGGITGMQERMKRTYKNMTERKEKTVFEPKDFKVIDEMKDPRELADELRDALNPFIKRSIVCLETSIQYESVNAAAETIGCSACNLSLALRSNTHYSHGFHWIYANEYEQLSEEEISYILTLKKTRSVVCLETSIHYESVGEAAENVTDISATSIYHACKTEPHYACGLHWMFEDEYSQLSGKEITKILTSRSGKEIRPIVCLETGVRYVDGGKAEKATGSSSGTVVQAAKSEKHYANGLHWMFEDEYKQLTEEEIARILTLKRYRSVVCLETGVRYESPVEAAKIAKTNNSTIVGACNKKTHYAVGFHWMYADEYDSISEEEISHILMLGAPTISYPVVCLETGIQYKSVGEAERASGAGGISGACKRKNHYSGGYHWMYANEYEQMSQKEISYILAQGGNGASRVVICLETGVQYESATNAAKSLGVGNLTIAQACRRKSHFSTGFHWMYADEYALLSEKEIAHILTLGKRTTKQTKES